MDSLTLKRHNSFQSENNRKATNTFTPRPLTFKLKQEVLKFNDICVSWSSRKTDLKTNFLNLANLSFENVSFTIWLICLHVIYNLFNIILKGWT